MDNQVKHSQSPKPTAVPCILGFVFLILLNNMGTAVAEPNFLVRAIANGPIALLESVVLAAASQVLQAFIFDHHALVQSLIQTLTSLWLLLLVVVAALLLKGHLRR
jgi:hypothetical protein